MIPVAEWRKRSSRLYRNQNRKNFICCNGILLGENQFGCHAPDKQFDVLELIFATNNQAQDI